MNYLVTGGSGYFGSLLVRRLLGPGNAVRVLDLCETAEQPDGVEVQKGDIRDREAVRRACAGVDVVFHCVAQVPLARDRQLFWSVNCDGTRCLLEAARVARVRKVVSLSSSAVFGVPRELPITASTLPAPVEEYGAAKLEGENLCRRFAEEGLDVTIIRPRTILGHGRLGIMQLVFQWVSQGRNVFVLGQGHNRYQFVHADDLAEACVKASARPGCAVYNIGAEKFGTMRETLEGLTAHASTGSRVRSLPHAPAVAAMKLTSWLGLSPLAPYHWLVYGREVFFDLTPAVRELDWRPQWSNIDMLIQSYKWYLANQHQVLLRQGQSPHRSPVKEGVLRLLRWL